MTALLEVVGLTKVFPIAKGERLLAVRDVSFALQHGETLGLVGESGSGKTTVGRCVLGLLEPTAGKVLLHGRDITSLSASAMRQLRPRMQLVFQDPFASLNPTLTVAQTIAEPLVLQGVDRTARRLRVAEMLRQVNLDGRLFGYYPADLTTSEQQRVGIARALVTRPEFVVLDEPTSALDPSARAEILSLLQAIQRETGTAYIFISHDLTSVARISHRIAVMYLGQIVEQAPTSVIMSRQRHPYSRALLSAVLFADPFLSPSVYIIEGEIPTAINPKPECPLYGRCPIRKSMCQNKIPPLVEVEQDHYSACLRWSELDSLFAVGRGSAGPVRLSS
jgi:oligopeptide/dipeptide ABC transporter ATP-binding protein